MLFTESLRFLIQVGLITNAHGAKAIVAQVDEILEADAGGLIDSRHLLSYLLLKYIVAYHLIIKYLP